MMVVKKSVKRKSGGKSTKKTEVRPVNVISHRTSDGVSRKVVPVGVKVISVINYIFAVLFAFLGGLILVLSNEVLSILKEEYVEFAEMTSGMVIFLGLILIGFAILAFFSGRGLWKGRQWARIFEIVIMVLFAISSLSNLFSGYAENIAAEIIYLVIYLAIGGYLLFSKEVSKAFI